MLLTEIMNSNFITVQSTESIEEAAKKMREKNMSTVLVIEKDRVKGILTEKEMSKAMTGATSVQDPDRCCYFNDVQIEALLGS